MMAELEDERGAELGDPRRCSRHGIATSSPDGMFDAPCGACEAEMDAAFAREEYEQERRGFASDPDFRAFQALEFGPVNWDAEEFRDEVGF
jgi:hypothetical protein